MEEATNWIKDLLEPLGRNGKRSARALQKAKEEGKPSRNSVDIPGSSAWCRAQSEQRD